MVMIKIISKHIKHLDGHLLKVRVKEIHYYFRDTDRNIPVYILDISCFHYTPRHKRSALACSYLNRSLDRVMSTAINVVCVTICDSKEGISKESLSAQQFVRNSSFSDMKFLVIL